MRAFRRPLRTASAALLLALAWVAHAPAASAQHGEWGYWQNGVSEPWWFNPEGFTLEEAERTVARWNAVGPPPPRAGLWAGDYFRGSETHGTYMRWSEQAGFVIAHVNKCAAQVTGVTHGRVEATPTVIKFIPEFSKASAAHGGHSHGAPARAPSVLRFVPVEWRGGRLLVPEEEMGDLGDYFAGLGKYNYWEFLYFWQTEFFTRMGARGAGEPEGEHDGAGAPVVPPGYERFLKRPIRATITGVGRRVLRREYSYENPDGSGASYPRASLTYVTVSAGTADGLKPGMFLRVSRPDEGDTVRIIRAGKSSSTGVVVRSIDDDGETFFGGESEQSRPRSKVSRGWKLTTSFF